MSFRLIEIVVTGHDLSELRELLREQAVTDIWIEGGGKGDRARILVAADRTEGVTDILQQSYGGRDGFRLVLLPVEATLPEPEEPVKDEAERRPPALHEPTQRKTTERISREELYQDVLDGTRLSTPYLITVALSTLVAAIGLVRGQVAVVIGAMVIAPLLGPNVGLALSATLGDLSLGRRAVQAIVVGILISAGLSVLLGFTMQVDPTAPELASRTHAGISDVVLAVAAGVAGALAYTTGLPTALIGVMVAVALLPPLVTAGLLAGSGYFDPAVRALGLLAANVACLNLAALVTFLAQGVRPRSLWAEEKAKRATRRAIGFWLILIIALVLIIIFLWD